MHDFLEQNKATGRYRKERATFEEAMEKMQYHTYPSKRDAYAKGYLDIRPNKLRYTKLEHQVRITLRVWDINRRTPGALFFRNDAPYHIARISGARGLRDFQEYLDEHRNELEQIFRIVMNQRDDWVKHNNGSKKEKKKSKKRVEAWKPPPFEDVLDAMPIGKNDEGGQINIIWALIGKGRPPNAQINGISNKSCNQFITQLFTQLRVPQDKRSQVTILLPETLKKIEVRFGKSAEDLTVGEVKHANLLLDQATWKEVQARALNSKSPLLAELGIAGMTIEEARSPKRKRDKDQQAPAAKKQKVTEVVESNNDDDDDDDDAQASLSAHEPRQGEANDGASEDGRADESLHAADAENESANGANADDPEGSDRMDENDDGDNDDSNECADDDANEDADKPATDEADDDTDADENAIDEANGAPNNDATSEDA